MNAEPLIRLPAVAGYFYSSDAVALAHEVRGFLDAAPKAGTPPKAIIVPHAGYRYSGAVAATVYARLIPARGLIHRVVLIGPSHRVAFRGLALTHAEAYRTPLGDIPIDREAVAALDQIDGVGYLEEAHAPEHSLEVQLPFLQEVLGPFTLVPVVAGDAAAQEVARLIEAAWGGPETLIVISSDLSHYHDYETCRDLDGRTTAAIESLNGDAIGRDQACGRVPVRGLLMTARKHRLSVETLDVRNSGDTAGPKDRVVGYGAWAFWEPPS